jgi:hypothetical protein
MKVVNDFCAKDGPMPTKRQTQMNNHFFMLAKVYVYRESHQESHSL